jgi:pyruvate formate lyase activating enzyme
MPTGLISNIQKYSLQDGPGIRTTVFLKGCPLQCAWCHNPENISPRPEVMFMPARCVRCGACRMICPQWEARRLSAQAAGATGGSRQVVRCTSCGACVDLCPSGARLQVGEEWTVEKLATELMADRIFYEDSGGGITFSGGEPLRQPEFLQAALSVCRERDLHTAVDTCGYAPREVLERIAPLVDLFLYDLKFLDEARHVEFCGVSNRLILDNLRVLADGTRDIWIRVPVIPGVNDHADELEGMAAFVASLGRVRQVNLLPYHRSGLHKFEQLGMENRLADVEPPTADQLRAAVARFTAVGLKAIAGG